MKIKLPKTTKKVIIDEKRKTVTTLLLGVDNTKIKFVGVAKCSPLDVFDADIGAKISYKRAKRQLLVAIRNEIRNEIRNARKYIEFSQSLINDLTNSIDGLKQGIYDEIDKVESKKK